MEIEYKNKDQNWQEQSTTYWFDVDGESFGLCDKGYGEETRLLDCDGCPVEECNDRGGILRILRDEVDHILLVEEATNPGSFL